MKASCSLCPTMRFASLLFISTFLATASAQATTLNNLPNLSTATAATSATSAASSAAPTSATSDASTAAASTAATTPTPPSTSLPATTTFGGSTASTTTNSVFHLTGLPTIEGAGIPTLVIPYTAGAPFMQKSALPQGTVFICVGAILGFLGACVLAWRGIVAWTINRSVKKAAMVQYTNDAKYGGFRNGAGIYSSAGVGSSMSLDHLTVAGKPAQKERTPSANLFFSPTATAGRQSPGPGTNRNSSAYLPAGYYAAGNAAPAGGAGMTTLGGSLGPATGGGYTRSRSMGPSPPASPGSPPSSGGTYTSSRGASREGHTSTRGASQAYRGERNSSVLYVPAGSARTSMAGLSGQPTSRAPSAYLEDLFENHGNGPRERF
ncbi:hypothetical protein BJ546DRAFT_255602 [Cryomyces antarcticus]